MLPNSRLFYKFRLILLFGVVILFNVVYLLANKSVYFRLTRTIEYKNPRLAEFETKYKLSALETNLDKALTTANKKVNIVVWSRPIHPPQPSFWLNWTECGACKVTYDKKLVTHPDTKAVVLYVKEIDKQPWPASRRSDQYYVWWTEESPSSIKRGRFTTKSYDKKFNLTMSYRHDSDVFSPFGTPAMILSRKTGNSSETQRLSLEQLMRRKKRLALVVISHCSWKAAAQERLKYVKELIAGGLKIDLAGSCFPNGIG